MNEWLMVLLALYLLLGALAVAVVVGLCAWVRKRIARRRSHERH